VRAPEAQEPKIHHEATKNTKKSISDRCRWSRRPEGNLLELTGVCALARRPWKTGDGSAKGREMKRIFCEQPRRHARKRKISRHSARFRFLRARSWLVVNLLIRQMVAALQRRKRLATIAP